MQKPKHILVFRFSAMGDVAITIPVLLALNESYPGLKVTVVTRPFYKPIFDNIPNVSVYTVDFKGKHKGLKGLFKLSRALLKIEFDAIADLHNVLRTKVLKLFLLGKQVETLDKGRPQKKALVEGKIFQPLKPTIVRYAEVFQKLGLQIDVTSANTKPKANLNPALEAYLNQDQQNLGIAPFAAHKGKMYPLDLMDKVIKTLAKTYNVVLFGGGEEEIKTLLQIEGKYTNVRSVAGKLDLEEELALMSHLDLMLSMDSGNAHLAAMYGIKVVTIWGVTHPYAGFAPFNQPKSNALLANRDLYPLIPTSIYGNKYPEAYEGCAGSISVETVVSKINDLMH